MEAKGEVKVDWGALLWPTLPEPGFRNAWRLCLYLWLKASGCASDCIDKLAELLQRDVCWRFVFWRCFSPDDLETLSLLRSGPASRLPQSNWSHEDWLHEVQARELLYKIQATTSTQARVAWLGSHSTLDMERIARGEFIFGAPFGAWSSRQGVGYEWAQREDWLRLAGLHPHLLVCDFGSTSHLAPQAILENLCWFLRGSQAPFCFLLEMHSTYDHSLRDARPMRIRGLSTLDAILNETFTTYEVRLHENGKRNVLEDDWVLVAERLPGAGHGPKRRKEPPGWAKKAFLYEKKDSDRRADLLAARVKAEVFRGPAGYSL